MAKETICSEDELARGSHGYEDHRSVTRIEYHKQPDKETQTSKSAERINRSKRPRETNKEGKDYKEFAVIRVVWSASQNRSPITHIHKGFSLHSK